MELVGKTRRAHAGALYQIVWLSGPFLMVALSYCLRDWQQIQLIASVPTVVFLLYWWSVLTFISVFSGWADSLAGSPSGRLINAIFIFRDALPTTWAG